MFRLFNEKAYCDKDNIEKQIQITVNEIAGLAKNLQQRSPFLADIASPSMFNETTLKNIQTKLNTNQAVIETLCQERTFAYKFIASIPLSMAASIISYSLGISFLKNILMIYQSGAAMWLAANHEFSHIKLSLMDLLTSPSLDALHQCNARLNSLCEDWINTIDLPDQNQETLKETEGLHRRI